MKGTVVFFSNAKGYGFIKPSEGGNDIFCHFSSIKANGFKSLIAGQTVDFKIVQGQKGPQADNVSVVEG
jgi:CspA family cold shock protein